MDWSWSCLDRYVFESREVILIAEPTMTLLLLHLLDQRSKTFLFFIPLGQGKLTSALAADSYYGVQQWREISGISKIKRDCKIQRRDGNENVKKQQLCTCSTLLHISLLFLQTTTWKCLIPRFTEKNVTKQRRNFISLSELGYGPLEFKFRRVRLYLTK